MNDDGHRNEHQHQVEILVAGFKGNLVAPTAALGRRIGLGSFQGFRSGAGISPSVKCAQLYWVRSVASGGLRERIHTGDEILQGLTEPKETMSGESRQRFGT